MAAEPVLSGEAALVDTALPPSIHTLLASPSTLVSVVLREQKQRLPALPTGSSRPFVRQQLQSHKDKDKMVKLPVLKIEYPGLGTW